MFKCEVLRLYLMIDKWAAVSCILLKQIQDMGIRDGTLLIAAMH